MAIDILLTNQLVYKNIMAGPIGTAGLAARTIIRHDNINEVDGPFVLDRNADLLKTPEQIAELSRDVALSASRRLLLGLRTPYRRRRL